MRIDRERALKAFQNYVREYDDTDPKIRLKRDHTLRVAALSDRLARSLAMEGEDADLAWLLGILHDVGRFEQVRRYGTFSDAKSVDHALLGARILFEGAAGAPGEIRRFAEEDAEDARIRRCVELHSVFRLPELDPRTERFAKILRDADKIDILHVNVIVPREDIYGVSSEEIATAGVTDEVLESFYRHSCVERRLKRTPADSLVGHISLVYELEFPESYRIVEENGDLEKMMNFSSDNPKTREVFAGIRREMQAYLREKAGI